jgi:hypothetical protein
MKDCSRTLGPDNPAGTQDVYWPVRITSVESPEDEPTFAALLGALIPA